MEDYVNSWAEQGVKCYIHLKDFEERRKFGMTNSVLILFATHSDASEVKRIKSGHKFQINPKAETIAAYINSCSDVPYYKSSYFIKAVVRMFRHADEETVEKVKKGIISLAQQPSAAAYLQSFENLANKGLQAKNRISFKTTTN